MLLKLLTEEKELLRDIAGTDGFKILLRVIDGLASDIERDVLRCVLGGDPSEERKLIQLKCRGEGARKLQTSLKTYLDLQLSVDRVKSHKTKVD